VITVLVVEDHPIVCEGVCEILAGTHDIRAGGTARDAAEALQMLRTGTWNVALLDLSLPDRGGVDLLNEVRQGWPQLPVLIFSMHAERHLVLSALRAGAAGYVTKDCSPGELVNAIRRVATGGKYVTAALSDTLVEELQGEAERPPHEELSARELEVFRMLAAGIGIKEIARRLQLSETTVSTYRSRLLVKMRLTSNADLIRYAIAHRLIS
jgi:two-component system invasion response regulator UvrY